LDSEHRRALLKLIDERPSGSRIRVLELVDSTQAEQAGDRYFVPWPCREEELMRWITAVLVGRFETAEDYAEGGDEDDQVWLGLKALQ
jgi:hypothetical protein